MTEREFIKFYKDRNHSKDYKEAKEKIELFWNAMLAALEEDERVVFKDWGIFEKKEVKTRKIMIPMLKKTVYTKPKEVIKFRAGMGLIKTINEKSDENE